MTLTLKNRFTLFVTSLFTALFMPVVHADWDANSSITNTLNLTNEASTENTYSSVQATLTGVLGFVRAAGIVVCVIMLVWCAIQLAASAGNNQKRQIAMEGIKNVLIAVAIIGAATLICSLAYGILK